MSRVRPRQQTGTFNLLNTIIIITTIITTTTAFIPDMDMDPGMDMAPVSWSCRDTAVITTTIITIITTTASTAATIGEPAGRRSNRTFWVLFFCVPLKPDAFLQANRYPLRLKTLLLAGFLFGRAMKMPVGPVEHGVRRRGPLGPGR